MLFPQKDIWELEQEESDDSGVSEALASKEENAAASGEEDGSSTGAEAEDYYLDRHVSLANQFYPSAMGMTFYTEDPRPALEVRVTGAWYGRCNWDECAVSLEDDVQSLLRETGADAFVIQAEGILKPTREFSWDEFNDVQRRARRLTPALSSDDIAELRDSGVLRRNEDVQAIIGRDYVEWSRLSEESVDGAALERLRTVWLVVWSVKKLKRQIEYGWQRKPVEFKVPLSDHGDGRFQKKLGDGLSLSCFTRTEEARGRVRHTVSLVNTHVSEGRAADEDVFCQAGLTIEATDGSPVFCDLPDPEAHVSDSERASLALL
jgi:hypothetical protein